VLERGPRQRRELVKVDPRFIEMSERSYDGLRKAGMPEE
jgi:hypothetical protein